MDVTLETPVAWEISRNYDGWCSELRVWADMSTILPKLNQVVNTSDTCHRMPRIGVTVHKQYTAVVTFESRPPTTTYRRRPRTPWLRQLTVYMSYIRAKFAAYLCIFTVYANLLYAYILRAN